MSVFQFEKILTAMFVVIIVCIAATGGYLWYVESRGIPTQQIASQDADDAVILEGTYVCLPRTDGAKGSECTPGIKVGEDYYALDMALVIESGTPTNLTNGMKILAGGVVVPIEEISSDQWRQYPVKGIMKVEEVAKL